MDAIDKDIRGKTRSSLKLKFKFKVPLVPMPVFETFNEKT